jgi:uncharacterized membrane protein YozB (DUF420 family)
MELSAFPAINASLNATSGVLLILGYTLIRQRAITAHTVAMIAACCTTLLFLGCYIFYHYHHGTTHFPGRGPVRVFYYMILVSHTFLAVVNVPFVVRTLYFALRGDFYRHAKSARKNFPIWLYVSVTGVIVYWMLYRVHYS